MAHDKTESLPSAITAGIRVTVETQFVPKESLPHRHQYLFAYRIRITNEGTEAAQLRTRHWIIADAAGGIEEVKGEGVVGEQPRLEPDRAHEYTSFCVLKSPRGTMHGTYQMFRDDGSSFDAEIPAFALVAPVDEAQQFLN